MNRNKLKALSRSAFWVPMVGIASLGLIFGLFTVGAALAGIPEAEGALGIGLIVGGLSLGIVAIGLWRIIRIGAELRDDGTPSKRGRG